LGLIFGVVPLSQCFPEVYTLVASGDQMEFSQKRAIQIKNVGHTKIMMTGSVTKVAKHSLGMSGHIGRI